MATNRSFNLTEDDDGQRVIPQAAYDNFPRVFVGEEIFTMPDPKSPGDHRETAYKAAKHQRFLANRCEGAAFGRHPFVITNMPPAHGKTEIATRRFAAWFVGKFPGENVMIGTYSEDKASDFKDDLIRIMEGRRHLQVFPDARVVKKEKDRIALANGSQIFTISRGGAATGRHAKLIIIDDPIKGAAEARSELTRFTLWQWFTRDIMSRRKGDDAAIMVTQTRWTDDDLTGRISDPQNPHFTKELAEDVEILNLAAFAEPGDPLGREEGEPLWPERYGKKFLNQSRATDHEGFSALYQGNPTPAEGVFYTRDILDKATYGPDEMPTDALTFYGASDHATGTKQINDPTCMLPFGIDAEGCVYITPEICWERIKSDIQVERMIAFMKARKPAAWFTAKGTIDTAIGPFLKARMIEEGCYTPLTGFAEREDKLQRAHSARARMAQGKIKFPANAPWWPRAKAQLLKFPNGAEADFGDALSLIGMAVDTLVTGTRVVKKEVIQPGTFGYMLRQTQRRVEKTHNGW